MSTRNRARNGSMFDGSGMAAPTLAEADSAIYGAITDIDKGRRSARPISIFEIAPDPMQPRRAMPFAVRAAWDGSPSADSMAAVFAAWIELVCKELGVSDYPLADFLEGHSDVRDTDRMGVYEASLMAVVDRATSIKNEGQLDPITVTSATRTAYQIERGEIRWLAFHLLYLYEQDQKWARILASVEPTRNVWRQAAENGARQNLNAIARARQIALLVMDIHSQRHVQFAPMHIYGTDREFYAQVADGNLYGIKGEVDKIMVACGFKNDAQIRQYRALLRISDDLWRAADDGNWSLVKIQAEQKKGRASVNENYTSLTKKIVASLQKHYQKAEAGDRAELIQSIRAWLDDIENGQA